MANCTGMIKSTTISGKGRIKDFTPKISMYKCEPYFQDLDATIFALMKGCPSHVLDTKTIKPAIATVCSSYLADSVKRRYVSIEPDQTKKYDPMNVSHKQVANNGIKQVNLKLMLAMCNCGVVTKVYLKKHRKQFDDFVKNVIVKAEEIHEIYNDILQHVDHEKLNYLMEYIRNRLANHSELTALMDQDISRRLAGVHIICHAVRRCRDFDWTTVTNLHPSITQEWEVMKGAMKAMKEDPMLGYKRDKYWPFNSKQMRNIGYVAKQLLFRTEIDVDVGHFKGFMRTGTTHASILDPMIDQYVLRFKQGLKPGSGDARQQDKPVESAAGIEAAATIRRTQPIVSNHYKSMLSRFPTKTDHSCD